MDEKACHSLSQHARIHGVQVLLYTRLSQGDVPASLLQALHDETVRHTVWELGHQQLLTTTLAALSAIGVEPVLLKGTALAYSLYSDPVARTRGDTDLIIPLHEKERVHEALLALGFERKLGVSGEFVSYQANYVKAAPGGVHSLDLHWKINNSELLSKLFTYDELRRDAQALPSLCQHALGACRVQALLIACMHRSTHRQNPYYTLDEAHHDPDRLIWLYDIHLLAGQLEDHEWTGFLHMADKKGLRAVCLEGLEHARACFHTELAPPIIAALSKPGSVEPPARYLDSGKLNQQWMDFCALASHSRRFRFVGELVFPPAAYMHGKYPGNETSWMPWLYLRRATSGFIKRLGREGTVK